MNNNKILVGSLEFDEIKANFIEYLKGQSTFSDYNFEGSNMSILLDVLAYNTYYNIIYNNMTLNEAFLDTASRRQSVVSLAKSLGYTPRSATCAKTRVSFKIPDPDNKISQTSIVLPRLTKFSGIKDAQRFNFVTQDTFSAIRQNDEYVFENISVIEGTPIESRYEYNDELNAILLRNRNIDISTMIVRVQLEGSTKYQVYRNGHIQERIDSNSQVFFIKETNEGYYELSFGDGILGKKVENGALVNVYYFVCNGIESNGINRLTYNGPTFFEISPVKLTDNNTGIDTLEPTNGGRLPETIDEIRYNAPNMYQAQNRAVTSKDYETIILNKVPSIKTVSVWGGEHNDPPIFGKVFISADTFSGQTLTKQEIDYIKSYILNEYKLITVIPEFVTPDFLKIQLDIVCYYDRNQIMSGSGDNDIIAKIENDVFTYNTSTLQRFSRIFRTSDIMRIVEAVDQSITSTVIRLRVYRTIIPKFYTNYNYEIKTGNPMVAGTIYSNGFYINQLNNECFFDDDGSGNLRLYYYRTGGERQNVRTIGSVNYNNGSLTLNELNIIRLSENDFTFNFIPSSNDVVGLPNQIVEINEDKTNVTMIPDNMLDGKVESGVSYTFTKNRLE